MKKGLPKSKKGYIFLAAVVLIVGAGIWLSWSNTEPVPQKVTPSNIRSGELPNIHVPSEAENLINTNALLVRGRITDTEYLRFDGRQNDPTCFITCYTLSVEEVIRGELQTTEVQIVSSAATNNPNIAYLCNPMTAHCGVGTAGLFSLSQPAAGVVWTINDFPVSASDYGDYCSTTHYRINEATGSLFILPWNRDLGITIEDLR